MEIVQIRLEKMATFSYIAADPATGECALVDPAFEVDRILEIVKEKGLRVTSLINTHCHSDHSAGNAEVAMKTEAGLLIHRLDAKYLKGIPNRLFTRILGGKKSPVPEKLLEDGDIIKVGESPLKVLHTPGHTPGSICLYNSGNLITGDTLFCGSIGRTDLPGGSLKELVASARGKLLTLPEKTIVWPGHDYGPTPYSTIENEKKTNPFI